MRIVSLCLASSLLVLSPNVLGNAETLNSELKVTEVISPKLFLFSDSDGTKVGEKNRSEVPIPLVILEQNGMRIKVKILDQVVWVGNPP